MDWSAFFSVSVAGVPLVFVVLGLVELTKRFGAAGKVLMGISMAIGLVLGVGYQLSVLPELPGSFAGWFAIVIYGLMLGLVASGVFDAGVQVVWKGQQDKMEPPF